MARARNIKPGFFRNADLVELSFEARLLFIGLWTLADRDGRLEDRPKQIKMELFPADSVDCNAMLDDLAATGMVARYTVDAKRYLQVVNFAKHQNPHKDERASTIPDQGGNLPAPCKPDANTVPAPCKPDANTVPAPCKPDANTVLVRLNPESLIPDPGFLNPESPTGGCTDAGASPPLLPAQPTPEPQTPVSLPSMAGAVCIALKSLGMGQVNPGNQTLKNLLSDGADIGMFVEAGRECVAIQKPFSYLLAMVKGRIADDLAIAEKATAVKSATTGMLPGAV
jgi:hypothetical protein